MAQTLSDPDSLGTIVFAIVFVSVFGAIVLTTFRKKPKQWRGRFDNQRAKNQLLPNIKSARSEPFHPVPPTESNDSAEQLRAVMGGTFTAKNVLSKTEARVMRAAEQAIVESGLNWRVMAQVALGEVLASPDEAAFRAINAKRVDLLVVSAKCEPLAAIEYQGQGHYQGTAPARDAIKKEALRKAGIRYIEITFEHGPDDVRREIGRMAWLQQQQPAQTKSSKAA